MNPKTIPSPRATSFDLGSQRLYAERFVFRGREWSELGSRDIDGKAGRPSERARASQWIADLDIYDYRHRLYNPDNGRFLQSDPTGFDAGDMNLFRYCDDDPVDGSDPTGLFDMWSNLTKFFIGNPSFALVQDVWDERRQDTAKVEFKYSVYTATPEYIKSKGGADGVAVTKVFDDGITTTSSNNQAGGVDVSQTVTTKTYVAKGSKIPKLGEKIDPVSRLGQEVVRIQRYRAATLVADLVAKNLARQGFTDRQSAERAVYESTRGLLDAETKAMRHDFDTYHGTDPGY